MLAACGTAGQPTKARVVVVGGGFGGATAAKYLRLLDPGIAVTLVEPSRRFVTCPASNAVLAKRFPDQWPVNVGLARSKAAQGDQKQALTYAKKAMSQAPDENSKKNLETLIQRLEKGEKI